MPGECHLEDLQLLVMCCIAKRPYTNRHHSLLTSFLQDIISVVFLFCQATDADDEQMKGIKMGVLTVLDDDDTVIDIALVLEETIVLKDITDAPTALAYLFGLLYALNMEFPKDIRYTFETIQHIFMEMSTNCSQRVRSFKTKLLNQ